MTYIPTALDREAAVLFVIAEEIATDIDDGRFGYNADSGVTTRTTGESPTAEFQIADANGDIFTVTITRGESYAAYEAAQTADPARY